MNYEKLSGSIRAVIDRRPGDNGAYSDLFSLCREWETEDFSAAHKVNKELLALSADQVVRGGGAKFYEQWRRCLLFEAPHDFDSFMTYIELDRKPEVAPLTRRVDRNNDERKIRCRSASRAPQGAWIEIALVNKTVPIE